jgi:hypothetical protein
MGSARRFMEMKAVEQQRIDSAYELSAHASFYLSNSQISQWEHDFLKSVVEQHKSGKSLSIKQMSIIQNIEKKLER